MKTLLRTVPELKALSDSEIDRLTSVATTVSLKKNNVVFRSGEKAEYAWFLLSGKVVLGDTSHNGNSSATCVAMKGDLFCCLPIMDMGLYTSTATCTQPSELLRIPLKEFNKVLSKNAAAYNQLVTRFCSRLREVECRQCGQADPASEKIATVLQQYYNRSGEKIELTRAEIAQLTGLTVETVIRSMSELKKKNIINGGRGYIKVLKPEALKLFPA